MPVSPTPAQARSVESVDQADSERQERPDSVIRNEPGEQGYKLHIDVADGQIPISWCAVRRRHSSAGANPARQLSLQPVAVGADDGGNDIG